MKTWLHRISYLAELSYPLLQKGWLSIGFSDFTGEPNFINEVISQGDNYLNGCCRRIWRDMPKTRLSLLKFIAGMKAGDKVLVPTSGAFSVYEIEDDLPYCIGAGVIDISGLTVGGGKVVLDKGLLCKANADGSPDQGPKGDGCFDLGFVRRVRRVIEDPIPRVYCDARLTSRLKIRVTTADISDLSASIDNAINCHKLKKPFDLHGKMLEQNAERVVELIRDNVNPDQFERLVKWYFQRAGATEVEIPPKNTRDKSGDADVVATFEPIKVIVYAQAKQHSGQESDWAVQQIAEYGENAVEDGYAKIRWVISMCDRFSPECVALAEQNDVMLFNGKAFAELILEAGISGLEGTLCSVPGVGAKG